MDVLHCNALIGLYARCGSLDYAQELFDEMSEKDEVTYGSLASGYMFHSLVQNNRHEDALDLTREMQACGCKPNTVTLSTYTSHGDADTSLSILYKMLNSGIQPDQVTFTAVLTACSHSGVVDEAWKIFDAMFPKYAILPSVEHYACMVSVLSRAGKLSEAADFIHKMPVEPSAKVWGALLNGASVSCDFE
ncbi:hypothetical protein C1H46_001310 [Malus baccata]|uniref:Pentacotripeptide-repeat region of PRORP domain-containing protein n=1 Tax=Malus baccata TaxID=106549 RepID=A0A540NQB9_MALBA|nr:hypothetical protein C1H46_001310 [Malus baccata]